MSIAPLTDLILDVANAADPVRRKLAMDRLAKLGESGGIADDFAAHVEAVETAASEGVNSSASTLLASVTDHHMPQSRDQKSGLQKFEAYILGNFIGLMLPKNTESVYGQGIAGDMWQSLMAQNLGDAVAKKGGLGLQARLTPHYLQSSIATRG